MIHNLEILSNKEQLTSVSLQPLYLLLSVSRHGTSNNQSGFIVWLCLGIFTQVAAIPDCFIAHVGWAQTRHRWGMTLVCTIQDTTKPMHPVYS